MVVGGEETVVVVGDVAVVVGGEGGGEIQIRPSLSSNPHSHAVNEFAITTSADTATAT